MRKFTFFSGEEFLICGTIILKIPILKTWIFICVFLKTGWSISAGSAMDLLIYFYLWRDL